MNKTLLQSVLARFGTKERVLAEALEIAAIQETLGLEVPASILIGKAPTIYKLLTDEQKMLLVGIEDAPEAKEMLEKMQNKNVVVRQGKPRKKQTVKKK